MFQKDVACYLVRLGCIADVCKVHEQVANPRGRGGELHATERTLADAVMTNTGGALLSK
jgi:hypothetical protein